MKNYIAIAFFVLLTVGCSKDYYNDVINPNEIRVNAQIDQTRASATSFEIGDKISLYAVEYSDGVAAKLQIGGNWLNNEQLTFDGMEWRSYRTLYWADALCDFYALYPYQEFTSIKNQYFEISTNQNSERTDEALGGYEASDILFAKAESVSRADGVVDLNFEHLMSKCIVEIHKGASFEGDIPNDIEVYIYSTSTSAEINLANGSLAAVSNGPRKTITMKKLSNTKFEAIVVPQNIHRRTPLFEVTMGGISYLLEYSMLFKSGRAHKIDVTINTSPNQEQEKIEIELDGEVGDWQ